MTDPQGPIEPESGGVRVYGWSWGRDEDRRPRLPWIGIFLVIFGALLLLDLAAQDRSFLVGHPATPSRPGSGSPATGSSSSST